MKEQEMGKSALETLHDVNTATNDVIKGYITMLERAEPEIVVTIRRLSDMHRQHASQLAAQINLLGGSDDGDSSFQGKVNQAVVIMRDWVAGLDRDALESVRDGEESLRDAYVDAVSDLSADAQPSVRVLLSAQHAEICDQISRVPKVHHNA